MPRALLASLEAGQSMPVACSLAEKGHPAKPGTRNDLCPRVNPIACSLVCASARLGAATRIDSYRQ